MNIEHYYSILLEMEKIVHFQIIFIAQFDHERSASKTRFKVDGFKTMKIPNSQSALDSKTADAKKI